MQRNKTNKHVGICVVYCFLKSVSTMPEIKRVQIMLIGNQAAEIVVLYGQRDNSSYYRCHQALRRS